MKTLIVISALTFSLGAVAQTASSSSENNGAASSATTNATGNQQSVFFAAPSDSLSSSNTTVQSITFTGPSDTNSTVKSSASINSTSVGTQTINTNSTGTTTQNVNTNNSGTAKNIVEYTGTYTLKNVPSVAGPNLTTSNDTCMGSTSGSANGTGFGISFGTTWTDEHCKRLKMSRELWNKGMKAASLAMDCMDATARVALEITGTPCPQSMTVEERRIAYGPQASAVGAAPSLPPVTAQVVTQPQPTTRTWPERSDLQASALYGN